MAYISQRAKHACKGCHARRVRCDVTEMQPCSNCKSSSATCEVLPSKRGRYPRKTRQPRDLAATAAELGNVETTGSVNSNHPQSGRTTSSSTTHSPRPSKRLRASPAVHQPEKLTESTGPAPLSTERSLFYGESNLLTLFPGPAHRVGAAATFEDAQIKRLSFPISNTLQTDRTHASPANLYPIKANTERYLIEADSLTFPNLESCLPALRAYFTWFHPCFPVLDRAEIAHSVNARTLSPLLFQAILFIAASYCDESSILAMGFHDRSEAKCRLYSRARLLFDADWEENRVTTLQALFLMSFWRGESSDVRDVRYWLGIAIAIAQNHGLHRLTRFSTKDPKMARMRRRIWWSIYVRERQASASLGLPSRIHDEDCDVEFLTAADLEADFDDCLATSFGNCEPEHIVYVIKMIDIARLLGKILSIHFAPSWKSSQMDDVKDLSAALEEWRQGLPDDMKKEPENEQDSVWTCLLYLAYNHLRILIHRNSFLRNIEDDNKQITINAACQISRIAEEMLTQKMIQFGQMHLITGLFAALCIHTIDIRMTNGVAKSLAEHRAKICLLGLKEVQKFWKINNHVLDLFFQYLDEPLAKKLHGNDAENVRRDELNNTGHRSNIPSTNMFFGASQSFMSPLQAEPNLVEDPNVDSLSMNGQGQNTFGDFEQFFDPLLYVNGDLQEDSFNFLERCL